MTETELRNKLVDAAGQYVGTRQGSPGHGEIVTLYNSYTPHPRGYALTVTDPWCAGFVSAMAVRCGLTAVIPVECSCSKMLALFRQMDRWVEQDDYVPGPGDIIFYDWGDNGTGDNSGAPDHVGIVQHHESGLIRVIEGNLRQAVGCRELNVNGKYIRGYGVPDYASLADPRTCIVRKGDTLWAIARRELGDPFRYPEIQKRNGLSGDVIFPGQVLKLPER